MSDEPLSPAEQCYICGEVIPKAERSMDHVLPKGLFLPGRRDGVITLPTHRICNNSFANDDEYFQLCVITAAAARSPQARQLWPKVVRSVHRPQARGLRKTVIEGLVRAPYQTPGEVYLGDLDVMTMEPARLQRVVDRIGRGIVAHETGVVLPRDWPVSSHLMEETELDGWMDFLEIKSGIGIGDGAVVYKYKQLDGDARQGLVWLQFHQVLHFWCFVGRAFQELGAAVRRDTVIVGAAVSRPLRHT